MLERKPIEEILDIYETLPKKITDLFWSDDVANRIKKIESSFGLTEKQGDALTGITAYLLLGILSPLSLEKTIKGELNLEENIAEKITDDYFRLLVFPLKPLLRHLYEENEFKRREGETPSEKEERERRGGVNDTYREPIE